MQAKNKIAISCAAILTSAVVGDYTNIMDNTVNPAIYRGPKSGCKEPFKLQKKYVVNEEGFIEVYIGYDGNYYKVEDGIRVNERSFEEMLKEEIDQVYEGSKKWYKSAGEVVKSFADWYAETQEKDNMGGTKDGK